MMPHYYEHEEHKVPDEWSNPEDLPGIVARQMGRHQHGPTPDQTQVSALAFSIARLDIDKLLAMVDEMYLHASYEALGMSKDAAMQALGMHHSEQAQAIRMKIRETFTTQAEARIAAIYGMTTKDLKQRLEEQPDKAAKKESLTSWPKITDTKLYGMISTMQQWRSLAGRMTEERDAAIAQVDILIRQRGEWKEMALTLLRDEALTGQGQNNALAVISTEIDRLKAVLLRLQVSTLAYYGADHPHMLIIADALEVAK